MLSAKSCTLARPAVARRAQRAGAVRPVAALSQSQVAKLAAGVATVALAASVVAPAEAANVVATVAGATEGWPFVPPSWAPSVLVPLTGLFVPAVAMASLFVYIEKEA